jgi:hypothetical protein
MVKITKGTYKKVDYMIVPHLGSYCAYVKLPAGHRYEMKSYDDMPIMCHGDLTFGMIIRKGQKTKVGFKPGHWIGWDYLHAGDSMQFPQFTDFKPKRTWGHKWTIPQIKKEIKQVIAQL